MPAAMASSLLSASRVMALVRTRAATTGGSQRSRMCSRRAAPRCSSKASSRRASSRTSPVAPRSTSPSVPERMRYFASASSSLTYSVFLPRRTP